MCILMNESLERRCIPISVLCSFENQVYSFPSAAVQFHLPSLAAAIIFFLKSNIQQIINNSCGRVHNNPPYSKEKNRYRSASLTVEAALAFPVFFFCVLYLIQMFLVLQAELSVSQAGITTARETAAVSYVTERLKKGENAVAEKILSVFDYKLIRDAAATAVFYERCDRDLLLRAGVAQGLGGIWTDTEVLGSQTRYRIWFRVAPANALLLQGRGYYCISLVARAWTGEGELKKKQKEAEEEQEAQKKAYLADNATVYHLDAECHYINIKAQAVAAEQIGNERNDSGAKYYACEFCKPGLLARSFVYITKYGTRYHALSTCSAIERNPKEVSLEEAAEKYRLCKKCEQKNAAQKEKTEE